MGKRFDGRNRKGDSPDFPSSNHEHRLLDVLDRPAANPIELATFKQRVAKPGSRATTAANSSMVVSSRWASVQSLKAASENEGTNDPELRISAKRLAKRWRDDS